jgi:transcriptional regulator GlxA family with amidase domain
LYTRRTTEILDVAPIDALSSISKKTLAEVPEELLPSAFTSQALDFEFHWVSEAGPSEISRLTSGISLVPTDSFATCPPLDIVLTGATNIGYVHTEAELAFTRKAYAEATACLTICGGMDLPLKAGVLDGKTCTAPRFLLDTFRKDAPSVNWVEKRWIRDGKIWTSGALLNGTDMMAAFVTEFWGKEDDSLGSIMTKMGGWPARDIDYKDVPWAV